MAIAVSAKQHRRLSRFLAWVSVIAIQGLVALPNALAQLTAPREAAPVELGPLSVYPSFQLLDAGRDSNIFNDSAEPKDDFGLTASSKVLTVAKLGLNELLFSSGADYVWFKEYKGERSNSGHYAARFNLSASRFQPFVGGIRTAMRSRPNPEIDARARRVDRTAVGGLSVTLTERTAITASMMIDDSLYDPGQFFRGVELAGPLNRKGRTFSGGVRYAVTPLTTLTVGGEYGKDVFPESHLRDSKYYSINPTLEFSPEAAIRGRLMAGYKIFQPVDPTLPENRGAVVAAALGWTLFGRTTFGLQASRNVNYSYQDNEQYYLWTSAQLNVDHTLFGPIDLIGTVDWDRLVYPTARVAPNLRRSDVTNRGGGGIGIRMTHGVKVRLMAERTERRSNKDPRQNFKGIRLLSSITVGS